MTLAAIDNSYRVEVTRTLNAARQRVFDAWVDAEAIKHWFVPDASIRCTSSSTDPRVGGAFRIEITFSDGDNEVGSGIYKEIVPPSRLVFTWNWKSSSVQKNESLITVNFAESDGKTIVTLIHEKLDSEESARRHTLGWNGCLDSFVQYIDGNTE